MIMLIVQQNWYRLTEDQMQSFMGTFQGREARTFINTSWSPHSPVTILWDSFPEFSGAL